MTTWEESGSWRDGPPSSLLQAWRDGLVSPPPVVALLGIRLESFGEGLARVRMEVRPDMRSAFGNLHGGLICDLADVAMGCALATRIERGTTFATLEMHTRYFRAVDAGTLTAEGRILHLGGRIAHLACEVSEETLGHVASTTSSCALRPER